MYYNMYYGFNKALFSKEELDRMPEEKRIAVAKSNKDSYETVIFVEGDPLGADYYQKEFWLYKTTVEAIHDADSRDTYAVSYSEYNDDGLFNITHLFKSKEEAVADKERLVKHAIDNWKSRCEFCKSEDEKDVDLYIEANDDDKFYICDYNDGDPFYARVTINKQIVR